MLDFDLTTFIFQIVNFIVLLLVLWRFFYRPVLRVMNRREAKVQAELDSAARAVEVAEQRNRDLDARDEAMRVEAETLVSAARTQANKERQEIVQLGRDQAEALLNEARRRVEHEELSARAANRTQIADTAVELALNMLGNVAATELHMALVDRLADAIRNMPSPASGTDAAVAGSADATSAIELSRDQSDLLEQALRDRFSSDLRMDCKVDPDLVAGCRIVVGGQSIDMTLRKLLGQVEARALQEAAES